MTYIYTAHRFSRIKQISSQNSPVISVLSKYCQSFTSPNVGIFMKFVQKFLPMLNHVNFNTIQNGLFWDCWWMGVGWGGVCKNAPLPKFCHTFPKMVKLGSYTLAKEDPKNTWITWHTLEFCWHQHFFIGNQQILLHQEIQI